MKMKFTIERSKWIRGNDEEGSRLVRALDGKMCCVGFFGLACGIPREQMLEMAYISEAGIRPLPEAAQWMAGNMDFGRSEEATDLYSTNDDIYISDHDREQRLTEMFAKHDIEVEFVE